MFPFRCYVLLADALLSWPQMFIKVLSIDSWDRCRTEGYGYVSLPTSPGLHTVVVSTWRPLLTNPTGEMRRFFIGGASELKDQDFVGIPADFQVCYKHMPLMRIRLFTEERLSLGLKQ